MRWPNASLQCYATMAMLKVLKVLKIQLKALSEIGKKARCHITLCCTFHKKTLQLYLIARQLQRLLWIQYKAILFNNGSNVWKKHVSHSLNTVDFQCSRLLGYARMLKCPVQFKTEFKICSEIEFYLLEIFCDNGQHPALGSRCCTHHLAVLNFMHWQMLPVCESWVQTRPQFILSRPGALPNVQYSTAILAKI